jgi:hypothetical protein
MDNRTIIVITKYLNLPVGIVMRLDGLPTVPQELMNKLVAVSDDLDIAKQTGHRIFPLESAHRRHD